MASDLSQSGDNDAPISSINITPFVDVVLVLLVIFMVTAPALMKDSIQINLPKVSKVDQKTMQTLGVAITAQGQFLLNGQLVTPEALTDEARRAITQNSEAQAVLSADGDAKHSDVVRAIDILKSAGLNRFAVQVERQKTVESQKE